MREPVCYGTDPCDMYPHYVIGALPCLYSYLARVVPVIYETLYAMEQTHVISTCTTCNILYILYLHTVVEVSQALSSSACYGIDPACDFYSMQCTSSQLIRLNNLYVGRKNKTVST